MPPLAVRRLSLETGSHGPHLTGALTNVSLDEGEHVAPPVADRASECDMRGSRASDAVALNGALAKSKERGNFATI